MGGHELGSGARSPVSSDSRTQIRVLHRVGADTPLAPADVADLGTLWDQGALLWIDVLHPTADLVDELASFFDFDPEAVEDVLDVEQLPKVNDYGDHVFLILHALTAAGDRVDTIEIDVFLRPSLLVTIHDGPVVSVDWLWGAVQQHGHLSDGGSDEILGHLAEVVGRRFFEIVNTLEARVDELAEPALEAKRHVLEETQLLRREEATVRRMLRPQRLALAELRTWHRTVEGPEAARYLDDAFDVHNQVVEALSSARSLLNDTLDTYRGAAAERQANATTILAVYSAILLPLSLIAGWYGMNVSGLPGADDRQGWLLVTGLMGLIAVGSVVVFIRVGLIRIPARRGRISRGLATAARAPATTITMLRRPRGE